MLNKHFIKYIILFVLTIGNGKLQSQLNSAEFNYLYINGKSTNSVLPVSIGVASLLYLINPIVAYTNKKLYAGLTKEISVGFGYFGEHRFGFEYSFIFGGNIRNYFRTSYKYDILLKSGLQPSNLFQGTSVFSLGGGYFTDFQSSGLFPEISYGYSIRNHKLLFYPHFKLRHTFMLKKLKPDITDFSFGILIGIANPFIDLKIRRNY